MKAALFSPVSYLGPPPRGGWPAAGAEYSSEIAQRSMGWALELFRLADEVGFDWVTVAEHHFAPLSLTPNPMVMAGALTQVVRKARIALLGADIPILDPVRVAEEFAMLDTMSGGRVIAGMLRGTANEYVTYNVNPDESRGRFEEALELIRMCWTETQPFGWEGRYYQYRTISIWPRPVQKPHPPIYISGSSPESGEFAARLRLSLGFAVTSLPIAEKAVAHYRAQAAIHGWTPGPDDVLWRLAVHVAETDEAAAEDMTAAAGHGPGFRPSRGFTALEAEVAGSSYYGRDAETQRARVSFGRSLEERVALGQLLVGSPETVVKQIRAIEARLGAGILDLVLAPQPPEKQRRSLELFGTRVLPRIAS